MLIKKIDFILFKINKIHALKFFFGILAHCLPLLYTWIPDQIQLNTPLEKPIPNIIQKNKFLYATTKLPLREEWSSRLSLIRVMRTHTWEGWGSPRSTPGRLGQGPVQVRLEYKVSVNTLHSLYPSLYF